MTAELHPNVKRVADILAAHGATGQVVVLPEPAPTAAAAAAQLGCEVGAIANSLVFMADERPLLVMTSGRHRVDTALLTKRLGKEKIRRAAPEEVREATGQAIGGVAPVESGSGAEIEDTAEDIAAAFTDAGFAASTRRVGTGVQVCQHHCPVSHVAEQFPELCEAEQEAFVEILGTHVQRLATIANGDSFCTTHVPLLPDPATHARTDSDP